MEVYILFLWEISFKQVDTNVRKNMRNVRRNMCIYNCPNEYSTIQYCPNEYCTIQYCPNNYSSTVQYYGNNIYSTI